ncbi:MAG: hypothetical protein IAE79_07485 [Anaerolinea sp.]|nr:hypothetical protein [Anaerolinea sp.]
MSVESRKEILDLLAGGKITVDEAAAMLTQVNDATTPEAPNPPEPPAPPVMEQATKPALTETAVTKETAVSSVTADGHKPTWFRVRVNNLETGKSKVSVNIPLRMFKFGFTIASHFTPEVAGLNMDEMQSMLLEGESGILVDVRDEESQEHVQVYID